MNGGVQESDAGYRKGLVLGLTLAEVGTLIIFVLLLLIGYDHLELSKFEGTVPVSAAEWKAIESERSRLQEVMEAAGLPRSAPSEDFTRLVRDLASLSKGQKFSAALQEVQDEVARLRRVQDDLRRLLSEFNVEQPEQVAGQLAAQAQTIADLESQKSQLVKQLGNGLVYPSCWYDEDGRIQYVYQVDLTSKGIRLMEIRHPGRELDRARLPFPDVNPSMILNPGEFLKATTPLFQWSEANECRFLVIIHDSTAPDEKPQYKSLMRTVEANFYKYESHEPVQF